LGDRAGVIELNPPPGQHVTRDAAAAEAAATRGTPSGAQQQQPLLRRCCHRCPAIADTQTTRYLNSSAAGSVFATT